MTLALLPLLFHPASAATIESTKDTYRMVDAGGEHNCALTRAGRAHCWGGERATDDQALEAPGGRFTQVSTGGNHSCGIAAFTGEALCWGIDDGSPYDLDQVTDTPSGIFTQVSAGGWHTCAVTRAQTVRASCPRPSATAFA